MIQLSLIVGPARRLGAGAKDARVTEQLSDPNDDEAMKHSFTICFNILQN
jgi:hypothetical protein